MNQYKCHDCSWVHAVIPLVQAEAAVLAANEYYLSKGLAPTETLESYLKCVRCGAPSNKFIPAQPGDVPFGTTINTVVML